MPRAKKSEVPETVEVKNEFTIYNERLEAVRKYSVEIHGENAGELAEMFVNKQKDIHNKVLIIK